MLVQAAAFGLASLVHRGVLLPGHAHSKAAIAETVIAGVLVLGLLVRGLQMAPARAAALLAQAFALLGTCVGLLTIAIGVGPQSGADLVFHIAVIALLVCGLVAAWRTPRTGAS